MSLKDYTIICLFTLSIGLGIWLSFEIQPNEYQVERDVDSTQTRTVDTVYADTTKREINPEIPDPNVDKDTVIITKTDTFRAEPKNGLSHIRTYNTPVSDSLLTGNIKTTVQGYLVTQTFTYTPSYPIEIQVNTTTTITETITKTLKPKPYPSIGLRATSNLNSLGFEITGSWTFQNGNRITAGYDPVLKSYSLGASLNLRNLFR